ncbi:CCE_0567 family metalloprotein [Mesorhizobium sp. LSHC440B00]|uniref:CCE_0567 family metalloprotein n=2 Tax=unclassified Mesorhizobium TaxID=325217 RepID=UPI0032AFB722
MPTWHGRDETDFEEGFMPKLDDGMKFRNLQLRAAVAKMKLRDLAVKWTEIEEVAEETSAVFAELDDARGELASMKKLR